MARMTGEAGAHGRLNGFPKTGTRVWYRSWKGSELQLGDYPGQPRPRIVRLNAAAAPVHDARGGGPFAPWLFHYWSHHGS